MARKKKRDKKSKTIPVEKAASSRKDIILDSALIMFVAILIGLAWQLYPDLSALVRGLIFVAALAVGIGTVALRAKNIIK